MARLSVRGDQRGRWARDVPPLVVVASVVAALALILPSALRVPPQDPTPVVEFAPVPPQDDNQPNPSGNLSSLSLGSSSTLEEPVQGDPPPDEGEGDRILQKDCVADPGADPPLRQTEDPMAPPCVGYFDGDNGGETWQGVSREEIRVLVYFDVGSYNNESSPGPQTYVDIDKPPLAPCPKGVGNGDPDTCDHQLIRQTRAMSKYFNDRFQTFDRHVHFWAYFARGGGETDRRADAVDNWDTIQPFAVIDQATFLGNNQAYQDALAARGVLVFTSETALPRAFFNAYPSFVWGFWPDVENWADLYVSYVCTKVAPYPVSRMGNPPGSDERVRDGAPRRLGLFYTTDPGEPGLHHFRRLVKKGLTDCGAEWVAEGNFSQNRFVVNARDTGTDQAEAIAKFIEEEVTTVLYLGGVEGKFSQLADRANYYPEIVIAGDLNQDNNYTGRHQNSNVWQNAWAVHFQLRMDKPEETPGFAAYRYGYPPAPKDEARYVNDVYRDHFILFQAIQVAGPELTPANVERGFRAIPEKSSDNPYVASCFFKTRDFSCVKDASEIWWDPSGVSNGDGQPGCWRYVEGGRRFLAGQWPPGPSETFQSKSDPCTGYDASRRLRLG